MSLSAGCYGKLPIHGDFIRHHVTGAEIDQLDEWIQGGMVSSRTAMSSAWDPAFDTTPPQRFLFQPRGGTRVVAGVVISSIDKPGRRFPFLIYTVLDPKAAGGEATLVPAALEAFLNAAEDCARHGWQGKDLKSFLATVDALPLPSGIDGGRQAILTFVAGRSIQAMWSESFGSETDARKYLLVHNLVETLRPGTVPRYALRLPYVSGAPEVSFWLEFTRKLAHRGGLPTLSVWGRTREGGPVGLTLLFDDLKANYFAPVWWPDRKNNLLFPLADAAPESDPRVQQARSRYAPILDDGAMRLSTLMTKLTAP
jgi:type VI secretion system protein ImpM